MENKYNISNVFLSLNQLLWKSSILQNMRLVFYFIDGILISVLKKVKKVESDKKKVLVVYNLALGDGIMFYEVSKSLREIYPKEQYELHIAVQKAFKTLYDNSGIYDEVIPFDFSGSVVNLKKRFFLFKELRKVKYDILLDPIGCENCTTNVFISRAALAEKKIGVLDEGLVRQTPKWVTKKVYDEVIKVNTSKKKIHLIEFYAEILRKLGAKDASAKLANIDDAEMKIELPKDFFVVFPTASMPVKRWCVDDFAEVAKNIYEKYNIPLVVCGTMHDKKIIDEMVSKLDNVDVIDLIGKTNIIQFITVIGKAKLVVSNDTSAYHIAVAKKVPTVLVGGGYTYTRYADYSYLSKTEHNSIIACKYMECYNCMNKCKYNNYDVYPCIDKITVEDVMQKVDEVIDDRGVF